MRSKFLVGSSAVQKKNKFLRLQTATSDAKRLAFFCHLGEKPKPLLDVTLKSRPLGAPLLKLLLCVRMPLEEGGRGEG